MQKTAEQDWNPMLNEAINVKTETGMKTLSFSEGELESRLENSTRLHLVHLIKKRQ
jgi:hypothetical protein